MLSQFIGVIRGPCNAFWASDSRAAKVLMHKSDAPIPNSFSIHDALMKLSQLGIDNQHGVESDRFPELCDTSIICIETLITRFYYFIQISMFSLLGLMWDTKSSDWVTERQKYS